MTDPKPAERDIYEVANQLGGYVDVTTPSDLAAFLLRESDEAAKLADEIVKLRRLTPPAGMVEREAEIRRECVELVLSFVADSDPADLAAYDEWTAARWELAHEIAAALGRVGS